MSVQNTLDGGDDIPQNLHAFGQMVLACLMALDKMGVSIAEMQRVLEIRDYRTAWLMTHKVRKAMAD